MIIHAGDDHITAVTVKVMRSGYWLTYPSHIQSKRKVQPPSDNFRFVPVLRDRTRLNSLQRAVPFLADADPRYGAPVRSGGVRVATLAARREHQGG